MKKSAASAIYIIIFAIVLSACAAKKAEPAPPELLPPSGVADDTSVATVRDVEIFDYYFARVRPVEHDVLFGNTSLSVKTDVAALGQAVKQGDVLLQLDTKDIQKNIDDLNIQLAGVKQQYEYADADRQTGIGVAKIQLQDYTGDNTGRQLKQLALQRLQLADSLAKNDEDEDISGREQDIADLQQKIDDAVLVADADGTVVSLLSPGAQVKPFTAGAVLADENDLYVEYAGKASSSLTNLVRATAKINGADGQYDNHGDRG